MGWLPFNWVLYQNFPSFSILIPFPHSKMITKIFKDEILKGSKS